MNAVDAVVVRRLRGSDNALVRQLVMSLSLAGGILVAFTFHLHAVVAVIVGLVLLALSWLALRQRRERTRIEADRESMKLGDETIARSAITGFHRLADPTRIVVTAGMHIREIMLSDEDADAFARALELDPEHKATTIPIGPFPIQRALGPLIFAGLMGLMAMRFLHRFDRYWIPAFVLCVLPMVLGAIPGSAEIGSDGILLRWLFVRRFIRARDIEKAEAGETPASAIVTLKNGTTVKIPVVLKSSPKPLVDAIARIRASPQDATIEEALLAERSNIAEWIGRLRKIATDAGFRTRVISVEHLWEVLEDKGAQPEARVAAAVALAPQLDEAGRTRVRVVTDTVASPHLRVALEAASNTETDSAELERLLKLVE